MIYLISGVDSDADLLLQLLEGHFCALALRRRPLAVDVDGGAPGWFREIGKNLGACLRN